MGTAMSQAAISEILRRCLPFTAGLQRPTALVGLLLEPAWQRC